MKLSIVLLVLFLAGCATGHDIQGFTALDKDKRVTNRTMVAWVVLDDVHAFCMDDLNMSQPVGAQALTPRGKVLACSRNTGNTCTIFTAKDTSMTLLGHELRHCFEGAFHDYN
jgi:hypothetical protein